MFTTVAEANSAIGRQPASRRPFSENSRPIDTNAKIRNHVRRSLTVAIVALPSDPLQVQRADDRRGDKAEHELREPFPELTEGVGLVGGLALDLQCEVRGQRDRDDADQRVLGGLDDRGDLQGVLTGDGT